MKHTLQLLTLMTLGAASSLYSAPPTITGIQLPGIQTQAHSQVNRNNHTTPTEQIRYDWEDMPVPATPEKKTCTGSQPQLITWDSMIIDCSNICTAFDSIDVSIEEIFLSKKYTDSKTHLIKPKKHLIQQAAFSTEEGAALKISVKNNVGDTVKCVKITNKNNDYSMKCYENQPICAKASWIISSNNTKTLKITLNLKSNENLKSQFNQFANDSIFQ